MAKKKWISGAIKRPGQLHRDLGVPQGHTSRSKDSREKTSSSSQEER